METVKIRLNIKSFMIFEKLTNKPFNSIDYQSTDDLADLLYSCFIANNDYKITKAAFLDLLSNKRIAKAITDPFTEEIKYMEQFNSETETESKAETSTHSDYYIRDVVPILVMNCNLDINHVLYELDLADLSLYLNTYNRQYQSNLEMQRVWCYYGVMPHIDSKKIKSPKDLIRFNWEVEEAVDTLKDWNIDKLDEALNKQIQK